MATTRMSRAARGPEAGQSWMTSSAVALRPGDQVRAGAQDLADHRHVRGGQDSVFSRTGYA
jgi:hypothetical protein